MKIKLVQVKKEDTPKLPEKKAEAKKESKKPLAGKLGRKEMEWLKERVGYSCSNKNCMEWSGRRYNYCPFCGRKAINSQFDKKAEEENK